MTVDVGFRVVLAPGWRATHRPKSKLIPERDGSGGVPWDAHLCFEVSDACRLFRFALEALMLCLGRRGRVCVHRVRARSERICESSFLENKPTAHSLRTRRWHTPPAAVKKTDGGKPQRARSVGVGVGRDSRYGSIYLSTPLSTARFVSRHPHSEGRPRRESVRFLRLYELLAWRCAGAELIPNRIRGVRGQSRELFRARALSSFVCV